MQNWSKGVVYASVALMGLGGLLIVLAWNGAAEQNLVAAQIPYQISGGLGGLALVGAGIALAVVHSLRREMMLIASKLDTLTEAVREAGVASSPGPTAVPEEERDRVAAGRTTYHRQDCHLVEGRDDLQVMSPTDARERGLAPCRICNPHRAETA